MKSLSTTVRFHLVKSGVLLLYIVLIVRIVSFVFLNKEGHQSKGMIKNLIQKSELAKNTRLNIVDRKGKVLAHDVTDYKFYLIPSKMMDIKSNLQTVTRLFPHLKDKEPMLLKQLYKKATVRNGLVLIEQKISYNQRQALLDNGVLGLYFENTHSRHYMYPGVTQHLVGGISYDGVGYSGVERSMNSYLSNPENSSPLELSIDVNIQLAIHNALYQKMAMLNAKGAAGVIMDIKTGEVIAAVSLPDCRSKNMCSGNELFNRFTHGVYELGSVFKLFLAGLAFENGISPYKEYERSAYIVDNFTIHDIDNKEVKGGMVNVIDIIKNSSNVGCARIIEEIGAEKQRRFLQNLGLVDKLSTEINEIGKPIYPKRWLPVNSVTISYGHGIAVSPLQFTSAVASLMNGEYVTPTFLKYKNERYSRHRVISDQARKRLQDVMEVVVSEGSGKRAYVSEYRIGGKSGTAIKQVNGKYDRHKMTLSFVAVAPIDEPRYVFFIMLDEPDANDLNNFQMRAGIVMAPLMHQIIASTGPLLGLKKKGNSATISDNPFLSKVKLE